MRGVKAEAEGIGREIDVYTVGVITCRPTQKDAEDYYRHCVGRATPTGRRSTSFWRRRTSAAATGAARGLRASATTTPRAWAACRSSAIRDFVAKQLAELSQAGLRGIGVSFVNYADELPYFCDEVLPRLARMGVRESRGGQSRESQ